MRGKRRVQKCELIDILNAVESGPQPWHTHNRGVLTGKVYPYFDSHMTDDHLRRSMIRQVTTQVDQGAKYGYIELSLSQVRSAVKGLEYLRKLDQPSPLCRSR